MNSHRIAFVTAAAIVAALLLAAVPAKAQLPKDPEERKKVLEQIFAANARQLTIFDRTGNEVTRVGPRDLYNQPVFSPDAKRIAVIKADPEKETNELWVLDVATGKGTQITFSQAREGVSAPAWSPDGKQVAYVAQRAGYFGLYRKPSDGDGPEELLYKSPGAPMTLTDWSMDGKYLTYFSTDLSGGTLYALPLNADGERKPIAAYHSTSQTQGPRLSPDDKFLSYASNQSGRNEVYIRPFDPSTSADAPPSAGPWQISEQGAPGMGFWRRDGKEFYFLAVDRGIMAVEVGSSPSSPFGKPKLLFRPSEAIPVSPGTASVNRDGDRFVIAVPPPQLRQLTLLDRQGKVLSTVGPPGLYGQMRFSPDGKRLAILKNDPKTGNSDIWTFDVATGKATQVTFSQPREGANSPVWSPDGKYLAYVSFRQPYNAIFRKAADGTGDEELLFRYTPGAGVPLTDWSRDGKFLTFFTGALLVVPLRAEEKALDRKAIEWLREDYDAFAGAFSPDERYLAYLSNEVELTTMQLYVRPFDSAKPEAPAGPAVQVTNNKSGAGGMFWRQDGKELIYVTRDREVMALDVTTTPTFRAGAPKLLFKLTDPLIGGGAVSPEGERFIVAMPAR